MGTEQPREQEASGSPGVGSALRLRIELWLALVFMAAAFGAGFAVRGMSEPAPGPAVQMPPGAVAPVAPPLTDEQIGQGLPPDHPPLEESPSPGAQGNGRSEEAEVAAPEGGS